MHPIATLDVLIGAMQSSIASLPGAWAAFSQSAAALAVTAAWQGAVVALGLAICLRLAPSSPAHHRFALWASGFGALVGLQFLPLLSHFFRTHAVVAPTAASAFSAPTAVSHPWLQLDARWSFLIASLWLAASLYRAGDLTLHSLHLRKLWKSAVPVDLDAASLPISFTQHGRRSPQLCITSGLERPGVIGFFAPRILIPDWLFSRLTPGELNQIILHETEHLRRRDDWTNLLQKLCLVLFPLNPGLVWIERRLCREREMACDDGVIRITRAPRAYAACLTSLAERGLQRRAGALSLGFWRRRPELVGRVHSILRRKHTLSPAAARAVLGALTFVLLLGSVGLARCPKLIAFVPAARVKKAEVATAQLTLAAARPVQEASIRKVSIPQAENVRAQRQTRRHQAVITDAAKRASGSRRALPAAEAQDAAAQMAAIPSETDTAPVVAAQGPEHAEGFVVLTTWQSVEMPGSVINQPGGKPGSNSDAPVHPDASLSPERRQQFARQIMVTRLLLRIYSSEPGTKPSAQTETYAGWLVIQL